MNEYFTCIFELDYFILFMQYPPPRVKFVLYEFSSTRRYAVILTTAITTAAQITLLIKPT